MLLIYFLIGAFFSVSSLWFFSGFGYKTGNLPPFLKRWNYLSLQDKKFLTIMAVMLLFAWLLVIPAAILLLTYKNYKD